MIIIKEINITKLFQEIKLVFPEIEYINKYGVDNYVFVGIDNENDLQSIIDSHEAMNLAEYKATKIAEIDNRTGELISMGYEFPPSSGQIFSLSANGQTNILALEVTKDDPAMEYPIEYNTLDDLNTFLIPNSATVHGMYLTALATKKARLDSGTALKNAVRIAASKVEVDAIVDAR